MSSGRNADRDADSETYKSRSIDRIKKKSLLQKIPSEPPACLDESITKSGEYWFLYRGELLFDRSRIPLIANRLETISDIDYEPVTGFEATINPWKTSRFIGEVERRRTELANRYSFLTPIPNPKIEQQTSPRRAVISLPYDYGSPPMRNEKEWKREHVKSHLREFDQWIYHTNVIKPAVDSVQRSDMNGPSV